MHNSTIRLTYMSLQNIRSKSKVTQIIHFAFCAKLPVQFLFIIFRSWFHRRFQFILFIENICRIEEKSIFKCWYLALSVKLTASATTLISSACFFLLSTSPEYITRWIEIKSLVSNWTIYMFGLYLWPQFVRS